MIEPLESMPAGTVGFRATGRVDWISKATHLFAWMVPGGIEVFGLDGLEDANSWVAE